MTQYRVNKPSFYHLIITNVWINPQQNNSSHTNEQTSDYNYYNHDSLRREINEPINNLFNNQMIYQFNPKHE